MMKRQAFVLLAIFGIAQFASAKVVPNPLFSDNMVLQRDMKVPIWGTADPGEKVTVEFAGQKKETEADEDGNWIVRLDPIKVSAEGRALIISGISISNVLVGDVWLGSGQSNMWIHTRRFARVDPDLAKAVDDGPYPSLRLYRKGAWAVADKVSMNRFSAIMFSFGHALHEEIKIPVGLMVGAVGGTPSGRWLTEEMAAANKDLMRKFEQATGLGSFEAMHARDEELAKEHAAKMAKAKDNGKRVRVFRPKVVVGDLYNKFIEPYEGYAIRGVLWDQGESKTRLPGVDQYTTMCALISGWRKAWGQGDFPFLHVQKPSGTGCAWAPENPMNRKARPFSKLPDKHVNGRSLVYPLSHVKMNTIENAPLVTVSDLAPGVHPPTKYAYGRRACLVALGTVYGRDLVTCGPLYKSHKIKGDKVVIKFNNIGKGLAFRHSDKIQGFEIAGEDGQWEWADAEIDGDVVIVSSEKVEKPANVRYAGSVKNHSFANLFNKNGLPALMFTTKD